MVVGSGSEVSGNTIQTLQIPLMGLLAPARPHAACAVLTSGGPSCFGASRVSEDLSRFLNMLFKRGLLLSILLLMLHLWRISPGTSGFYPYILFYEPGLNHGCRVLCWYIDLSQ